MYLVTTAERQKRHNSVNWKLMKRKVVEREIDANDVNGILYYSNAQFKFPQKILNWVLADASVFVYGFVCRAVSGLVLCLSVWWFVHIHLKFVYFNSSIFVYLACALENTHTHTNAHGACVCIYLSSVSTNYVYRPGWHSNGASKSAYVFYLPYTTHNFLSSFLTKFLCN